MVAPVTIHDLEMMTLLTCTVCSRDIESQPRLHWVRRASRGGGHKTSLSHEREFSILSKAVYYTRYAPPEIITYIPELSPHLDFPLCPLVVPQPNAHNPPI